MKYYTTINPYVDGARVWDEPMNSLLAAGGGADTCDATDGSGLVWVRVKAADAALDPEAFVEVAAAGPDGEIRFTIDRQAQALAAALAVEQEAAQARAQAEQAAQLLADQLEAMLNG